MVELLKKYLDARKAKKVIDYLQEKTMVETLCEDINDECELFCFDKKGKISYHKVLSNLNLSSETKNIISSYMVVVKTSVHRVKQVVDNFGHICKGQKCYGPIVFSEEDYVVFFPKLRYQDGYFIKGILHMEFGEEKHYVAYGSNDLIMI